MYELSTAFLPSKSLVFDLITSKYVNSSENFMQDTKSIGLYGQDTHVQKNTELKQSGN